MTVLDKFQSAIAQGEALDWSMLHIQLDEEHARAQTTRERENLLALFALMADMLAEFQEVRRRSYQRLLLREACLDGLLCARALNVITAREVINGRMLQDDPMRLAAIIGLARQTAGRDTASQSQPGVSARPALVAGLAGGAWQWLLAAVAALAQRSTAMWQTTPGNRTV